MGASSAELFGNTAPEPATPGSYGEAPTGYRLPNETRLGVVRLDISDLDRSLTYYQRVLGFRVIGRNEKARVATLGTIDDDTPILELNEVAGARPVTRRGRLGLYHFAILLPNRAALGSFVQHLADLGVYAGAGDHLVSEAFYLQDPDNLGIEVYADRPRETWRRRGRELMLATDPVNVPDLVRAAEGIEWKGMPRGTVIGHVHLHVGDLVQGARFFVESLGFDRMGWSYPSALFLGAGGYHHHLGTNTWAGSGAEHPVEGDVRLREWTIVLPMLADIDAVTASLTRGGYLTEREEAGSLVTRDPWGTAVRVVAAGE